MLARVLTCSHVGKTESTLNWIRLYCQTGLEFDKNICLIQNLPSDIIYSEFLTIKKVLCFCFYWMNVLSLKLKVSKFCQKLSKPNSTINLSSTLIQRNQSWIGYKNDLTPPLPSPTTQTHCQKDLKSKAGQCQGKLKERSRKGQRLEPLKPIKSSYLRLS